MTTTTLTPAPPVRHTYLCPACQMPVTVTTVGPTDGVRIAAAADRNHHPCPARYPDIDPVDRLIIPALTAVGYLPREVIILPSGRAIVGAKLAQWRYPEPAPGKDRR